MDSKWKQWAIERKVAWESGGKKMPLEVVTRRRHTAKNAMRELDLQLRKLQDKLKTRIKNLEELTDNHLSRLDIYFP